MSSTRYIVETNLRPFRSCFRSANDVDARRPREQGRTDAMTEAAASTAAAEVEQMMMKVTAEAAAMMMAMDI